MLSGVQTKINFSLNLSRVDSKVVPAKLERIAHHLQFFSIFELARLVTRTLRFREPVEDGYLRLQRLILRLSQVFSFRRRKQQVILYCVALLV